MGGKKEDESGPARAFSTAYPCYVMNVNRFLKRYGGADRRLDSHQAQTASRP